jgi:hypothetical protein
MVKRFQTIFQFIVNWSVSYLALCVATDLSFKFHISEQSSTFRHLLFYFCKLI